MLARYRITEQDYANAMRLHARPGRTAWALQIAVGLGLGLALFFFITREGSVAAFLALAFGGVAVGTAMFLTVSRGLVPGIARRQYRRYPAMQDDFTFELLDDGVRFASPHGRGILPWRQMLKWRENEAYVLIYRSPTLFHVVPKSIAAQGFDLAALSARLHEHAGAPV